MPFPWRDFAWFTILIGLAIGFAVEEKRVRELSERQRIAAKWEGAARALGEKIAKQTGYKFRCEELRRIDFVSADGRYGRDWVSIGRVRETRERDHSVLTGMADLDFILAILLGSSLFFGAGLWFRKATPTAGKSFHKASIHITRWTRPVSLVMFSAFAINSYLSRMPFIGAVHLAFGVLMMTNFIVNFHRFKLTPELAQQIDENYEQPLDFQASFLRQWPLRDFFWLTLLIGLSLGILNEHKRARELSLHQGRAEWWQKAAQGLQVKYDQLK